MGESTDHIFFNKLRLLVLTKSAFSAVQSLHKGDGTSAPGNIFQLAAVLGATLLSTIFALLPNDTSRFQSKTYPRLIQSTALKETTTVIQLPRLNNSVRSSEAQTDHCDNLENQLDTLTVSGKNVRLICEGRNWREMVNNLKRMHNLLGTDINEEIQSFQRNDRPQMSGSRNFMSARNERMFNRRRNRPYQSKSRKTTTLGKPHPRSEVISSPKKRIWWPYRPRENKQSPLRESSLSFQTESRDIVAAEEKSAYEELIRCCGNLEGDPDSFTIIGENVSFHFERVKRGEMIENLLRIHSPTDIINNIRASSFQEKDLGQMHHQRGSTSSDETDVSPERRSILHKLRKMISSLKKFLSLPRRNTSTPRGDFPYQSKSTAMRYTPPMKKQVTQSDVWNEGRHSPVNNTSFHRGEGPERSNWRDPDPPYRREPDPTYRREPDPTYRREPDPTYRREPDSTYRRELDPTYRRERDLTGNWRDP